MNSSIKLEKLIPKIREYDDQIQIINDLGNKIDNINVMLTGEINEFVLQSCIEILDKCLDSEKDLLIDIYCKMIKIIEE